jgi:hypothetical protein
MPKQLTTRIAWFWVTGALSGSFTGMTAAIVARLDGVGGISGWRWIFLFDGALTIISGVLCCFFLVNSPGTSSKWLSPDEIRFLRIQNLIKEGGKFSEAVSREVMHESHWDDIKAIFSNWRLWVKAYVMVCIGTCSWGMCIILEVLAKIKMLTSSTVQASSLPCRPSRKPWACQTRTHN